jgi:hypothetical protein
LLQRTAGIVERRLQMSDCEYHPSTATAVSFTFPTTIVTRDTSMKRSRFFVVTAVLAAAAYAVVAGAAGDQRVSFRLRKTIQVVPDDNYRTGGFCRVNYLRSKDRFIVTFGTGDYGPPEKRRGQAPARQGQVFKEYTSDMESTGRHGYFFYGGGDSASVMVNDTYYFLTGGPGGQRLIKFDPTTWRELGRAHLALDRKREGSNDQMLAFVNGRLDASSIYRVSGGPAVPQRGEGTWHQFFTPDLKFIEKRIFTQPPQETGASMVFVDGVYHFLTSTAFFGDLEVIKFDKDWRVIGSQILVKDAQWPQGTVYDAQAGRFYVAYLDMSQRGCPNARLAAFDRDWRLLGSVAVTHFQRGDRKAAGRPWVIQHNGLFYVSYDTDTSDARGETNFDWQAFVSVYEVVK